MVEDGTPEETTGHEPAPLEGTSPETAAPGAPDSDAPTPEQISSVPAADETQELPAIQPETPAEPVAEAPLELPLDLPAAESVDEAPSEVTAVVEEVTGEPPVDESPADESPADVAEAGASDAEPVSAPEPADVEQADVEQADVEQADVEQADVEQADVEVVAAAVPAAAGPAHAAPGGRSAWRTVLAIVASVAILAGVGIAGYAYGRSSAPGPDIVVQQEPVTEESADTEAMPVNVMPSMVAPILSVRNEAIGAPTAVLTPAAGLDDTPGTAMGYKLVNSGISGGQIASVLATAFGVKGSTIQQGDTWTVGKENGPQVVVTDDALFSWVFQDPDKLANPIVGQQLEPADAIDLANTMLSSIGVDTNSVDWQVDRYFDRTAVTAWQVIADQRTQLRWLVAFDPEGSVVEAAGFSAGLEPVASYPVVGAATAVNRSNTPPWWTLGATLVSPAPDGAVAPSSEPTVAEQPEASTAASDAPGPEETASPAASPLGSEDVFGAESASPETLASEPASAVSSAPASTDAATATQPGLVVRVDDVVVTDAQLGLAQFWQPDGSVLMLPSYVLTGLDGSTWSLIAVTDEYVAFVPSTDPSGTDSTS